MIHQKLSRQNGKIILELDNEKTVEILQPTQEHMIQLGLLINSDSDIEDIVHYVLEGQLDIHEIQTIIPNSDLMPIVMAWQTMASVHYGSKFYKEEITKALNPSVDKKKE